MLYDYSTRRTVQYWQGATGATISSKLLKLISWCTGRGFQVRNIAADALADTKADTETQPAEPP
jgi:hypothetical protein